MKIILKHIFRNIRENKARSILIIFSLIITSCLFILNLSLPNEVVKKLEESIRIENGKADIEVSSRELFDLDDIKKSDEEINYTGILYVEGMYNDTSVILEGYNISLAKEMDILGDDVPNLKDNEIVVNDEYAKKYGYSEGDIITIVVDGELYDLKIVKIVSRKGALYEVYDQIYFITNIDTVASIDKIDNSKFQAILIDVKNDEYIDSYTKYLQDNNDGFEIIKVVDYDDINEQVSYISYLLAIIAVISIIMIFFVVSSLNRVIVTERIPVIGTFRSVGATKNKMNFILVLENAVYGLIGGTIGSLFGVTLINRLIPLLAYIPNVEVVSDLPDISILSILVSILFTILLEILMSLHSIFKVNRKTVKELMFDNSNTRYEYNKLYVLLGIMFFILSFIVTFMNSMSNFVLAAVSIILFLVGISNIVPLFLRIVSFIVGEISKFLNMTVCNLASKNVCNNKMNIASCKLILISLSCSLAILTLSSSISRTFESYRYIYDFDILVDGISKKSEDYNILNSIEGVERIEYLYYYYDLYPTFDDKDFNINPIILGIEESDPSIMELDKKIDTLADNELLIDEKYAKKNNITKGDKIKLNLKVIGYERDYIVAGYINSVDFSTSRNVIVVNLDSFKKNISDIPVRISLVLDDSVDIAKTEEKIKKMLAEPNISIMTYEEFINIQEEGTGEILSLVYVIVGIAVLLSFIGVINNQIISFMERKKELCILNSTCMSKKQISKLLLSELLITNISSCILAFGMGFLMTNMLGKVLESMSLFVEMNFDVFLSIKFILLIFMVLLVTLIVPIRRLYKLKLIDEIKYE